MARQFVDLSIFLENKVASGPPFMRPVTAYFTRSLRTKGALAGPSRRGFNMNKVLPGFGAACAVLCSPFACGAEPGFTEAQQQVLRVDRMWADAEIRRDAIALRRILDDSFIAVYGSGKVVDKETFINNVVGDSSDKILSQDFGDISVRVQGDAAVVVETDTARGTDNGQPYVTALRLTTTYIKRNGHWMALAENFARATDLRADEAMIRRADSDWVAAAQSKRVDAWLAFYTDDAVVLPPNDKVANGREDARKSVGELLALPDLAIAWEPTKIAGANRLRRRSLAALPQGRYDNHRRVTQQHAQ